MSLEQKSKLVQTAKVITLALVLGLGTSLVLANWTPPPTAPTTCDSSTDGCNLPINVSAVGQTKVGNLSVNNLFSNTNLEFLGEIITPVNSAGSPGNPCPSGYTIWKNNSGLWDCTLFSPGFWIDEDGPGLGATTTTDVVRDVQIQGNLQIDNDILVRDFGGTTKGLSCGANQVLVKAGASYGGWWHCTPYSPGFWAATTTDHLGNLTSGSIVNINSPADTVHIKKNLSLPNTNTTGTEGVIKFGGKRMIHNKGLYNVFVGEDAGSLLPDSAGGVRGNTSVGFKSLSSLPSAGLVSGNSAFGQFSLEKNNLGFENTAIGSLAMASSTGSNYSVAVGSEALKLTTGILSDYNTAVGSHALRDSLTGKENTAIGADALGQSGSGDRNTAVGYQSAYRDGALVDNTAMGYQALHEHGGTQNVAIGSYALHGGAMSAANDNTAVGFNALYSNGPSTLIGQSASSTAVGSHALYSNTTGALNTAVGAKALYNNTSASQNSALGYEALFSVNTASDQRNAAFGYQALRNTGGGVSMDNTAVGNEAAKGAIAGVRQNTAVGSGAMYTFGINLSGVNNTAVGFSSGSNIAGGTENTLIGSQSKLTSGNEFNATAIGASTTPNCSNCVILGRNANVGIGLTAPSQKLDILGGGLKLLPGTAVKPSPCNASVRGTIWFTTGASADTIEVCRQTSPGVYSWVAL